MDYRGIDRTERLVCRSCPPRRFDTKLDERGNNCYGLEIFAEEDVPVKVLFLDNTLMPHGAPHTHEFFQICYIYKGECEHGIGKLEQHLLPGDVFVIPPGITHSLRASSGSDVRLFLCDFMTVFLNEHFTTLEENRGVRDFAYIEPFLASENKVRPRLALSEEGQVEAERLLFGMAEECHSTPPGYRLALRARLLELLVLLWREYQRGEYDCAAAAVVKTHVDAINDTLAFLESNYQDDLKLKDVCTYAMMSQSYFSRFFKLVTKMTFVDYMHDLRIRKATELLRSSRLKVIDICHEVGFRDITHFNRVFRARVGMCPSVYRKMAT